MLVYDWRRAFNCDKENENDWKTLNGNLKEGGVTCLSFSDKICTLEGFFSLIVVRKFDFFFIIMIEK